MGRYIEDNTKILYELLLSNQIKKSHLSTALLISTTQQLNVLEILENNGLIEHDAITAAYASVADIEFLDLERNYQILNYSYIYNYCKLGYFICYDIENNSKIFVTYNRTLIPTSPEDVDEIKLIKKSDFYILLSKTFARFNTLKSKYHLDFNAKHSTAKNLNYVRAFIASTSIFIFLVLCMTKLCFIISHSIYFVQNLLKSYLFCIASTNAKPISIIKNQYYPTYTILLPLYKEASSVKGLLEHMMKMIYPKSKLDIKVIVEDDDTEVLKVLNKISLPEYFHIVRVPVSFPRTKPKALNYAMQYSKGECVVIYDAEDRPDVNQLVMAADIFASTPNKCACLQAKLNFYNREENLLVKLFSIEYSVWFDFLLTGLDLKKLPVTLGGTSNHFRINALRKVGYWDPYNVTEDADLGLRLYKQGYTTSIINTYTMEEGTLSIKAWLFQRTRWIKGFLQVFCVYLKSITFNDLLSNPKSHFVILTFIGFTTYGLAIPPWLLVYGIKSNSTLVSHMILVNLVFTLSYMYSVAFIVIKKIG